MVPLTTVRVFISSTFSDMHSERDHLVKYVFPRLRDRLIKKNVYLVDVDLRWGLTADEIENGRVLDICLDEIDKSRPFFVGLLGEKYGSSLREYTVLDHPRFDWVKKEERGLSVTELEMIYGALKNPENNQRCFFYIRRSDFIRDVPLAKKGDLVSEDEKSMLQLRSLKRAIKDKVRKENIYDGYPCHYRGIKVNLDQVRVYVESAISDDEMKMLETVVSDGIVEMEDYKNRLNGRCQEILNQYGAVCLGGLEDFGSRVEEDLFRAISDEFRLGEEEKDEFTREREEHERFGLSRARSFAGREGVQKELERYVSGPSRDPLLLVGDSGCGKTALLAMLLQHMQDEQMFTFWHFVGITPGSEQIDRILLRIVKELQEQFGVEADLESYSEHDRLCETFRRLLKELGALRRIMIVIDAIDQVPEKSAPKFYDWLPEQLPQNVKLILSARELIAAAIPREFRITTIQVPPLNETEKREVITHILGEYRKELIYDNVANVDQMARLLQANESSKPLYLVVASEELRILPNAQEVSSYLTRLPETVNELFQKVIMRLEVENGREIVKHALSYIACARGGLFENEILELLARESGSVLPFSVWAKLSSAIHPYLRRSGAHKEGLISFFHQQLIDAVSAHYLSDKLSIRLTHKQLADYFKEKIVVEENGKTWYEGFSPRGFSEVIFHYAMADQYEECKKMLTDFSFLLTRCKLGQLEMIMNDFGLVNLTTGDETREKLQPWYSFLQENLHLIHRGNSSWPGFKIMFQTAIERTNEDPVHLAAEQYRNSGKVDWIYLASLRCPPKFQRNPCTAVFEGHKAAVNGAIQLTDGNVLSWAADGNLIIWDTNGTIIRTLRGHTSSVEGAMELHDGNILSWSVDSTLRLWDRFGNPTQTLVGHSEIVDGVIELQNHGFLSWSSMEGKALLWGEDARPRTVIKGKQIYSAIKLSSGKIVVFEKGSGLGATAGIYSSGGKLLRELETEVYYFVELTNGDIFTCACASNTTFSIWDSNGELKYSCSWDCRETPLTVKELSNGDIFVATMETASVFDSHLDEIETISGSFCEFGDDVPTLLGLPSRPWIVLYHKTLESLNVTDVTSDGIFDLEGSPLRRMTGSIKLPNGLFLTWGSDLIRSTEMKLWNRDGEIIKELDTGDKVNGAILLKNGEILSWWAYWLHKWDLRMPNQSTPEGHTGDIRDVIELKGERLLTWSATDESILLWDHSGNLIRILTRLQEGIIGLLRLKRGDLLSWSVDFKMYTWDSSGNLISICQLKHEKEDRLIGTLELEDGNILTWSRALTVSVWDRTWNLIGQLKGPGLGILEALSEIVGIRELKDGSILVCPHRGEISLWNKETDEVTYIESSFYHNSGIAELEGGLLALWNDYVVEIWDAKGRYLKKCWSFLSDIDKVIEFDVKKILAVSRAKRKAAMFDVQDCINPHHGNSYAGFGKMALLIKLIEPLLSERSKQHLERISNKRANREHSEEIDLDIFYKSHPELISRIEGSEMTSNNFMFLRGFDSRCQVVSVSSLPFAVAEWHCDSILSPRYLYPDGTVIVTTTGGQIYFLQLFRGKERLRIDALSREANILGLGQ